jgi:hypothetical protein
MIPLHLMACGYRGMGEKPAPPFETERSLSQDIEAGQICQDKIE